MIAGPVQGGRTGGAPRRSVAGEAKRLQIAIPKKLRRYCNQGYSAYFGRFFLFRPGFCGGGVPSDRLCGPTRSRLIQRKALVHRRDVHFAVAGGAQRVRECRGLVDFAVDEEEFLAAARQGVGVGFQFAGVGVGAESVHHHDLGLELVPLAVNVDVLVSFDDPPAQRVHRLEADDQDRVPLVFHCVP